MIEYVGGATVGGWFGVSRTTVAKWRERYDDCPPPDATIDGVPGWLRGRKADWEAWHATAPFESTRSVMEAAETGEHEEWWHEVVLDLHKDAGG